MRPTFLQTDGMLAFYDEVVGSVMRWLAHATPALLRAGRGWRIGEAFSEALVYCQCAAGTLRAVSVVQSWVIANLTRRQRAEGLNFI
ncbi:hypothetical protein [Burkholderia sp. b13]|uniref:hypothetical protein n=1 Tax=Burkholderia sp. b13 TaxID=1761774 RepID=UPI0011159673|nr:hypothetical protein [Burkholderia sp. b13]